MKVSVIYGLHDLCHPVLLPGKKKALHFAEGLFQDSIVR
jgi:hypothetical protein